MPEPYAPEWLRFEADLGYRPKLDGDIDAIYKQWDALGKDLVSKFTFKRPDDSVRREERTIGTKGNQVRIYTPPAPESSALCVYIHGGGWALGDLDAEDAQCEEFCKRAGLIVVSIGYRLAPKHKYPAPLDDCCDGFTWAVTHASTFGARADKVILAGGSAGANLAIATTLRLVDQGSQILPHGLFLAVPVTVDPNAVPDELRSKYTSYVENSDTGPNTPGGMHGFSSAYGPDAADKYYSVLLHDKLRSLPKTYVAIASKDTLRDDARLFVEKLQSEGVNVRFKEYKGFPHYFWTFPGKSLEGPAEEYQKDSLDAMRWLVS